MAYRIDVYMPGTGFLFSTDPATMPDGDKAGAAYATLRQAMPTARISVSYVNTTIMDCTAAFANSYEVVQKVLSMK